MASSVAFGLLSFIVIVAAWRVVTSPNIVRAALALVIVLAGMAPIFLLVGAEFLAVVQVLVYVGAVIVLFLFGIMLTRSPLGKQEQDHARRWPGALAAVGLFGALWYAITDAVGRVKAAPEDPTTTAAVGISLLRDHVLAFEAVSVLLLAGLIGSVVLARRS